MKKFITENINFTGFSQSTPLPAQPHFVTANSSLANNASSLTYPLSQLNISDNQVVDPEDGVSAFLNGNYTNPSNEYFQNPSETCDYPENEDVEEQLYYSYQSQPARIWKNRLKGQPTSNFFIDPNLKSELISRQLTLQANDNDNSYPSTIEHFHNIKLLSNPNSTNRNVSEFVYRGIKATDGQTYCLKRVLVNRLYNQKQLLLCENWKRLSHSNVIQLREIFQTRAFNKNSYIFVYDFFPLAETLKFHYFGRNTHDQSLMLSKHVVNQKIGGLSEVLIWNYVIQLSSAIRYIHSSGLAIRLFDISRILFCEKTRVLISSCGIADVMQGDNGNKNNTVAHQVEDLRSFGQVLLVLVTGRLNAAQAENISLSMQYIDQHCSLDLKNVIQTMLNAKVSGHKITSINVIMPMIGARFYSHIENLQLKSDYLEDELSKEVENGRLFRILCKLNTVNERYDPNIDAMWSETGDRYFLKMFRDYIFHQVNASGKAWIDLSHITMCLNKLDAGVDESIQLVARDGDNVFIVTFAELKKCLENSFNYLISPQFSIPHMNSSEISNGLINVITEIKHTLSISESDDNLGQNKPS